MKTIVRKNEMLKAINNVVGAVESSTTIPILQNILIEFDGGVMTVTASNMDTQITSRVPCDNDSQFEFTVNGKLIFDIIKKVDNDDCIEIELIDDKEIIVIKFGKSRFTLSIVPACEFPLMDKVHKYEASFALNRHHMKNLIGRVLHAASTEETRYYLNGIYWHAENNTLTAVATDGHRMAIVKQGDFHNAFSGIIIPVSTCKLMAKMAIESNDITVYVSPTLICVQSNQSELISKLIDGTYPDYSRIIPNHNRTLNVDAGELINAISMASIISDQKSKAVKLIISPRSIEIKSSNDGNESRVSITCDASDPCEIGFSAKYILESLNNINGRAVIQYNGFNDAITVTDNSDSDFINIVMPMKI